jgi:hypothetical protein
MSAFMPTGLSVSRPDELETLPELVPVDVGKRDRLDDADPAGVGHGRDQLGVAAWVHGAADERHFDSGVAGQRCVEHRSFRSVLAS